MEIMKQMLKARQRIELAMFTLAESSGIDDVLIEFTRHGIPVVGVLDGMQVNQKWAATRPVKDAGAELHYVRKSDVVGKLHHKLMVLDGEMIIAGSFNHTGPATRLNDESVIVVGDLAARTKRARTRQAKIARFARGEIRRIVRVFGVGVGAG
jgi:phosphatidylserine/phosphatidylglycerophosphate/cardiolipin synthase-like enzyme